MFVLKGTCDAKGGSLRRVEDEAACGLESGLEADLILVKNYFCRQCAAFRLDLD